MKEKKRILIEDDSVVVPNGVNVSPEDMEIHRRIRHEKKYQRDGREGLKRFLTHGGEGKSEAEGTRDEARARASVRDCIPRLTL